MDTLDISTEVLATLRKIIRAMDMHSKHLMKTYGLTGPQIMLLREINAHEHINVSQLAKKVSLSQATVTSIIDRLETKEYVIRTRSKTDKRRVVLAVTNSAVQKLGSEPSVLQEKFVERFNHLADWEQSLIFSSLQRIAAMMEIEELTEGIETEEPHI